MKKYYFIIFFFVFFVSGNAQNINFSDPLFKSKLLESSPSNFIARDLNGDFFAIDSNGNGEIDMNEALQLGYLEVNGYAISSLGGISNFTNLVSLECENNLLQSLNVSMLIYLTNLNCSNNQLNNLNVSGLIELQNLNCQFNQLANLNASGITNLIDLDCSYNQLVSVNLVNLENLVNLNCSNNLIGTVDLTDLVNLKFIDFSYNQFTSIDTSNLTSLESLNCAFNLLTTLSVNSLINFKDLNCSNNLLTSLNLISLLSLTDLNCNFNQLPLINLNDLINLKNLYCTNNNFISLNLNGLNDLENLYCSNNQIAAISLDGLTNLITLNCNNNQLSSIDLSSLTSLKYLNCNSNLVTAINTNGLNTLLSMSCSNNLITILNLNSMIQLQSLYCMNNQIGTLNASNLINLQSLFCSNNQLGSLFIKNGSNESNLQFSGNPNLQYICADESEIEFVQDEINNNAYTNCFVNSYCSFVPGGLYYTVQGNSKFDNNNNGCDAIDSNYPTLQLLFSDGTDTDTLFPNTSGNYSKSVKSGSYTITPKLENPNYFTVSPITTSVNFPPTVSPYNQNFCIAANGNHSDIEITILPLNNALPGFDATYKIIYKNKGTISQSGTVNLNFNDAVLDLTTANPTATSQSTNNLYWSFVNLLPLESRSILVTLNVNSATENPPVNAGQLLTSTASVTTSNTDETPNNNTSRLNQIVVNSAATNNKTCIEGNSISTSQVGDYVHYIIRFKNNGTAIAQNIVVKDEIDTLKFDITTLIPINGSHAFETRLSNLNKVEFIFQNINLAFNSPNNECFVAFKIKTLATLVVGNTFTNTSTIYFDYKAPLSTNTTSTVIQTLENQIFDFSNNFTVYPNPAKEVLNINYTDEFTINSFSIYNTLGQLIQIISDPNDKSIDVSELKTGIYILTITSDKGIASIKFIKE